MKAKIPANLTKNQRNTIRQEAYKQCVDVHQAYEHALDTLIAYTLHTELGFGQKRIQDFFNAMVKHQISIKRAYAGGSTDDNEMPEFVMEVKLRDDGVDLPAILENIELYTTKMLSK